MTRIEYRDLLGNVITEEQKNSLSEYTKFVYDSFSKKLKMKLKCFENDVVWDGEYYMDSTETITNLITTLNQSHRWQIMSNLESINGYNIWTGNHYHDGELYEMYWKHVFNPNGDLIAEMSFDANNQTAIGVIKKFYLRNKNKIDENGDIVGIFEEEDYVIFAFDSDGSFEVDSSDNDIFFKPYLTLESFLKSQQNGYVMNLMTQEMKDYYLNFHPLVPPFQI